MKKSKCIPDEAVLKVIAEGSTMKNEWEFWRLTADQRHELDAGRERELLVRRQAVLDVERYAGLGRDAAVAREEFRSDQFSSERIFAISNQIRDPDLRSRYTDHIVWYLKYKTTDSISRLSELRFYEEHRGYIHRNLNLWIPILGFSISLALGFMFSAAVGIITALLTYITMVETTMHGNVEMMTFATVGRIGRRIASELATEDELHARLRKIETLFPIDPPQAAKVIGD